MQTDKSLIGDVRRHFKDASEDIRSDVERQIENYETACLLARGPDEGRAEHWKPKAELAEKTLRRKVSPEKTKLRQVA